MLHGKSVALAPHAHVMHEGCCSGSWVVKVEVLLLLYNVPRGSRRGTLVVLRLYMSLGSDNNVFSEFQQCDLRRGGGVKHIYDRHT